MPGNDRVLVVMRTKDRPLFLRRAVASVAKQSHQNLRCVVVNDGGDAGCVEKAIAEASKGRSDCFLVVHNPISVGMEAASNKGLALEDADYFAIHDDDDSWSPDFLEACINHLKSVPQGSVQGVVAKTIKVYEEVVDNAIVERKRSDYNPDIKAFTIPRVAQNNPFMPIAFVYSRYALNFLKGYDETLPVVGDWEFNLRFIRHFDIAFCSATTAYYHVRVGGSVGSSANSISKTELHQYYRSLVLNRYLRQEMNDGGLSMAHILTATEASLWSNRLGERAASLYAAIKESFLKLFRVFPRWRKPQ